MSDDAIESPDADEDHLKPLDLDPTAAAKRKHFHETKADGRRHTNHCSIAEPSSPSV